MTLATWHFHIEISSKCTLSCPRCARQEVPDTLVNTELDLEFFQRNFTPEFIHNNVEKITFCGDDGDPIYAHDLIPVVRYIKKIKPVEIVIVTNGSYKKTAWWQELGSVLTNKDSVHFSIDGFDQNSNNLYRVNSDYQSIQLGISTLRSYSECRLVWAAIAFKFNEDHISYMRDQAQALHMDRFQLTKSTKFGKIYPIYGANDELQPSSKFISSSQRFERVADYFTNKTDHIHDINLELYKQIKEYDSVKPLCHVGNKGLYISARGLLYPCCWVANRYTHNNEWAQIAESFNLHKRTLADCINDSFWTTKFLSFQWQECKTKCNTRVVDEKYATEW